MDREASSIQEGSQSRDNERKTRLAGIGEKPTNLKRLQITPQMIQKKITRTLQW